MANNGARSTRPESLMPSDGAPRRRSCKYLWGNTLAWGSSAVDDEPLWRALRETKWKQGKSFREEKSIVGNGRLVRSISQAWASGGHVLQMTRHWTEVRPNVEEEGCAAFRAPLKHQYSWCLIKQVRAATTPTQTWTEEVMVGHVWPKDWLLTARLFFSMRKNGFRCSFPTL